jgi:GNAT superfamily N-acetyltransferase
MHLLAKVSSAQKILPLRTRFREEMNCQIVKDSIHRRDGWTLSYLLEVGGTKAGFGSVAIAGPWKDKPTIIEFYLLPEYRVRAFDFFEVLLASSPALFFEAQSNDLMLTMMALTYGHDIVTESIVFHDQLATTHGAGGAMLRSLTAAEEVCACIERRQGGGEWVLELDGNQVAKGGILFHYNRPYGDIYMDVNEQFRQRGLGSYLVQELKRECYNFGAVPCARCNPTNVASRRTLQRAGFVPFAHILVGSLTSEVKNP